ncbi:hypothetical protein QF038_000388 [Pseudarthrobacter sp. W1I19]|uniref:hypothetical protein n=1 Tax=Pseudarthrobacter sp. W1I19 TaxID=3042288 RepID=UPI00277EC94D|nr:hypothetical protein [Pseudarthrobacter sp. W1I19]MDQ0921880.1 hypothetical protein [Pseudarthrobacter sp. W1I19]
MAAFLVAAPVTGCEAKEQPGGENLQEFRSMDEAYMAVDGALACEADPVGDPIVPMGDDIRLASAQKLCFEKVQIDLFVNEKTFRETYQILSDSNQGKIHLVHGKNWMVVDFTEIATGQPSTRDIGRLVKELNGEYVIAGS